MKIKCNLITEGIKNLAKQIGKSDAYTCNLVSVWQTQNNSVEDPTAAQLNDLLKANKEQSLDIYFAIPNYEVREYNPNEVPIEHIGPLVKLMLLPSQNPMEHFYNMYKNLPELRDLVKTPEEAYRFTLWREMAFMQRGLNKKVENRPIAENEALNKMKEWRKRHPVVKEEARKEKEEGKKEEVTGPTYNWARTASDGYEVSSRGDSRFSALNAKFAPGTTLFGHDVSNRTIESVYQHGVKQGDWGTDNNSKTGAPKDKTIITGNTENDSYIQGYLPLWQEWARQNPQLIEELRQKVQGRVITDMFASTAVSQARALADILSNTNVQKSSVSQSQVVAQEDNGDVYKVPEIGTEVIDVSTTNPMIKLAKEFTAIERKDRVEMLARNFSKIIDRGVQEKLREATDALNEETSKETPDEGELNRLKSKIALFNDAVLGRRAVMQEKTVQQIIEEMHSQIEDYAAMSPKELDEDYGEGRGEHMHNAYQKILDNWEALIEEACMEVENLENVRIIIDKHSYHEGDNTREVIDGTIAENTDEVNADEEANDDDTEGKRADGNLGWSYKARFTDPLTSMARTTKNILYNLVDTKINGEPKVDDLGNIKFLNGEYAHAVLINDLSWMVDSDDFAIRKEDGTYDFPALEKVEKKYSWARQVINALQADPSLIGAFYADFRKDFIPYWIQYYDERKGKWVTHQLNKANALSSTKARIAINYEQGTILDGDSIYDVGKSISKDNAKIGLNLSNELISLLREFDQDDYDAIASKTSKALRMVGLDSNEGVVKNLLNTPEGIKGLQNTVQALRNIFSGVETMKEDAHLINEFSDDYNTIAQEVGLVSELDNVSSFRIGKNTRYSYSSPNYLDTMFKTFKDDVRRDPYLQEQFGKYWWFKNQETGQWRNEWLRLIETDEDVRDKIAFKELPEIGGVEYESWQPTQIKEAFIREYFSVGINPSSKKQFAYYNLPIFSDSPVVKFIKFLRYTTDNEGTFKDKLLPLFNQIVKQELARISKVRERIKNNATPIANFDGERGLKFCFFPELNTGEYVDFITRAEELSSNLEELDNLINTSLLDIMDSNFREFLRNNLNDKVVDTLRGEFKADAIIADDSQFVDALEEYFWNQAFATSQIIQLTTTDLAYYKDDVDFQKRYKEVYAPGIKLFTNSEYGRQTERTLYLADQSITASGYLNIKESLDRAVKLGHIKSFDRDNILHKFKDINVADAQAYRSLSSMRAVLDMIGAWKPEMQAAMDRFESGDWDMADFNIVWQTIKPFVFTQLDKRDGLGGSIKVPHQNKNSEFLLLAMYQMVASSTGKSSKLRALSRFMEDKGIDVIQFESAVKAGKQGVIDINYSESKLQAWYKANPNEAKRVQDAAKKVLKSKFNTSNSTKIFKEGNDYLLDNGSITQEEYNERFNAIEPDEQEVYDTLEKFSMENGDFKPDVVHEIPYEDYIIQQPTPEHLFDNEAVFGSQFRNLVISDMPDDPNFRVKINGKEYTKQEVLNLYNSIIVENLLEDWKKVKGKFADIESLQAAIFAAIKGNPKYGADTITALQIVEVVNPNTGEKQKVFNIPLDNPSTTNKIQEITTSIFKNGITKQTIKGASCILVSDFGLTDELHIIYGEDGSIQGIPCYLPAYSRQFYEPFMVTRRNSNGEEYQELDINKMPLELRKIVGYRIPTEDKYSMAPLIVQGFLPQQNGSSIMLPADITQIAGSDFDVDKMFLMIPEFKVLKYDMRKARQDFANMNSQFKEVMSLFSNSQLAEDLSSADTNDFKEWFSENKRKYEYAVPKVRKVKYDVGKLPQEQSRAARNNMLIDISYGILTHPDTAEKILNPGNFDKAKIAARIATIISNRELVEEFADEYRLSKDYVPDFGTVNKKLLQMSREGNLAELDDFIKKHKVERSQLTVDTFIYNHKQNMTGAALIGTYAISTSMQAKYQPTSIGIKEDNIFAINGKEIQSLHDIFSQDGERISKNCANFSAASVDNVKDPVLADLMQNRNTAKVTGFMLRAGMSIEEIGLMFSQPIIRQCIEDTGDLAKLSDYIQRARTDVGAGIGSAAYKTHTFTSEELLANVLNNYDENLSEEEITESKVNEILAAQLMVHIHKMANALNELNKLSRSDSPSSAIKPSLSAAKNQARALDWYMSEANKKEFPLVGVQDTIKNRYITPDMSVDQMREKLLKCKMPLLQAFYSLGIELAGRTMSDYYSQTTDYSDNMLDYVCDNSDKGIISDKLVTAFHNELVEFALSKTKLFGDDGESTFDEKRDYYLYDFPSEILSIIANNPDIAKINAIKKLQVKDGDIIMLNSGKLTPLMKKSLMLDFDRLLFDESNPEAQKLAIDLLMYSYYKDGLRFGPNSFGTFFSSNFLAAFPELVSTLRTLKFDMKEGTYFDRFLPQFYANHGLDYGLLPDMTNSDVLIAKDGTIAIDSRACLNKHQLYKGIVKSYPLIIYGGNLYSLKLDGRDRAIYEPSATLSPSQKRGRVKYNANMPASEMVEINPDQKRIEANEKLNPSFTNFGFDNLEVPNSGEDDTFIGDDSLLAGLSGFTEEDYDIMSGQSQLDKEMCL